MRYILVDRIVLLEPHRRLVAFKQMTATDGLAESYGGGMPALPGAMLLEAMAQAAGLLVLGSVAEPVQPVLAKVQPFEARRMAQAGERIDLEATLDHLRPEGGRASVTASVEGTTIADASVHLALIPVGEPAQQRRLAEQLAALFPDYFHAASAAKGAS